VKDEEGSDADEAPALVIDVGQKREEESSRSSSTTPTKKRKSTLEEEKPDKKRRRRSTESSDQSPSKPKQVSLLKRNQPQSAVEPVKKDLDYVDRELEAMFEERERGEALISKSSTNVPKL